MMSMNNNKDTVRINKKTLIYAFISRNGQVFTSVRDESVIILNQLACKECRAKFSKNISECFLCGSTNSFLQKCKGCGEYSSITNSSQKCNKCNKDTFYKFCANQKCISNTNGRIQKIFHQKGGIFDKNNSDMNISLFRCDKCACDINIYKTKKIIISSKIPDSPDENVYYIYNEKESFMIRIMSEGKERVKRKSDLGQVAEYILNN